MSLAISLISRGIGIKSIDISLKIRDELLISSKVANLVEEGFLGLFSISRTILELNG
jgi:hypothetical protein